MKTLTVRKVPDDVYTGLAAWAAANHRSLQEQVRHILEREVRLVGRSPLDLAGDWRRSLADRRLGDVVAMVREDRDR